MRIKRFTSLIVICCLVGFCISAQGQANQIKIVFKVDEKEVIDKFKIIFYLDGSKIEPRVTNARFHLPDLTGQEKVNIEFIAGNYDLFFQDIKTSELDRLDGNLIIGTKTKPFKPEDIPSGIRLDENLTIKYIEFSKIGIGVTRKTYYEYEYEIIDMP